MPFGASLQDLAQMIFAQQQAGLGPVQAGAQASAQAGRQSSAQAADQTFRGGLATAEMAQQAIQLAQQLQESRAARAQQAQQFAASQSQSGLQNIMQLQAQVGLERDKIAGRLQEAMFSEGAKDRRAVMQEEGRSTRAERFAGIQERFAAAAESAATEKKDLRDAQTKFAEERTAASKQKREQEAAAIAAGAGPADVARQRAERESFELEARVANVTREALEALKPKLGGIAMDEEIPLDPKVKAGLEKVANTMQTLLADLQAKRVKPSAAASDVPDFSKLSPEQLGALQKIKAAGTDPRAVLQVLQESRPLFDTAPEDVQAYLDDVLAAEAAEASRDLLDAAAPALPDEVSLDLFGSYDGTPDQQ